MVLYFIVLAVFGIIMGIAPEIVADNVEICAENDLAQKEKAKRRIKLWLYFFGLAIYLSLALFSLQVGFGFENEIKELESRIEVLEQQTTQIDTTTVDIRNI